jgi:hypothetical protein
MKIPIVDSLSRQFRRTKTGRGHSLAHHRLIPLRRFDYNASNSIYRIRDTLTETPQKIEFEFPCVRPLVSALGPHWLLTWKVPWLPTAGSSTAPYLAQPMNERNRTNARLC